MFFKAVQLRKVSTPIKLRLSGKFIVVNLGQFQKTCCPMLVHLLPLAKVTFSKEMHCSKLSLSIDVTPVSYTHLDVYKRQM